MFKIIKTDKHTDARTGILTTPHGKILTPAYTIVATKAAIKCLKPRDIAATGTQVVISNTYHLWDKALSNLAGRQKRKKEKHLVHKLLGKKIPIMTDSGGFQVFSLGFGPVVEVPTATKSQKKYRNFHYQVGKILSAAQQLKHGGRQIKRTGVKITNKGVFFNIDGKRKFLGPELSMKLQESLGADIIFAFDECTSPLDNFSYNQRALLRTHRWAKKCLAQIANRKGQSPKQLLFGIVQGGRFASLRAKSARFIGSLPFDGFGIGGSFGKDEMVKTLKTVMPRLPKEKPRHLLGIGRIKDVFEAVENGVDLFDCVIPTREARHGRLWTSDGALDIRKTVFQNSKSPIEKRCRCPACKSGITRSKLNVLFKTGLPKAQRYATIHNVWFFNNLMKNIRASIERGSFQQLKKKFLKNL